MLPVVDSRFVCSVTAFPVGGPNKGVPYKPLGFKGSVSTKRVVAVELPHYHHRLLQSCWRKKSGLGGCEMKDRREGGCSGGGHFCVLFDVTFGYS